MQQIADWLEEIGMSEYAERFAANAIDTTVLGHLTDQDLKDLGVSLGHRRKILAAIAGYRAVPLLLSSNRWSDPHQCHQASRPSNLRRM